MDLIQLKRGLESAWENLNPTLASGEVGIIFDNDTGFAKGIKIGDGKTSYSGLRLIGEGSGGISPEEAEKLLRQANEYTDSQITSNNSLVVLLKNLGSPNSVLQSISTDENLDIIFRGVDASSGLPFTFNFTNLLKQEGVFDRIGVELATDVEILKIAVGNFQQLIPAGTDVNNPLVNQRIVETLVSQGNGLIITSNAEGEAFKTKEALLAGPYFSAGKQVTDIPIRSTAKVLSDSGYNGSQTQYAWDGANWVYQNTITSMSFNQGQLDAINSGVTKAGLDEIKSNIATNKAEINTETTRATNRENKLETDIQTNKTNIDNLNTSVGTINTSLNNLQKDVNNKVSKSQPTLSNNFLYVNENHEVVGTSDAPSDGSQYARKNGVWEKVQVSESDPFYTSTNQKFVQLDETNTSQSDKIKKIEDIIPNGASSTNKLVDNSSMRAAIAASGGRMLASNANGAPFKSLGALTGAQTFYFGTEVVTPATNDKTTVLSDETHDNATTQYIYSGDRWIYYTTLSALTFSDAQMAAINSEITKEKLENIESNIETLDSGFPSKADKITAYTNTGVISSSGSGYKVNEIISFSDGSDSYNGTITSVEANGAITGITFYNLPVLVNLGGRAFNLSGGSGTGAVVTFTSSSSSKNLIDVYTNLSEKIESNKSSITSNTTEITSIKNDLGTASLETTDKTLKGAINEVNQKLSGISLEADKVSYNDTVGLNSENVQEALDTLASSVTGRWKTNQVLETSLAPDSRITAEFSVNTLIKLTSETQTPAIGQLISDASGTEYIITSVSEDNSTVSAVCIFVHTPKNLLNRNVDGYVTRVGNSSDIIIERDNADNTISSGVKFNQSYLELFYKTTTQIASVRVQPDGLYLSVSDIGGTPSFKKLATAENVNKKLDKLTDTSTKLRAYTRSASSTEDNFTYVDTGVSNSTIAQRTSDGKLKAAAPTTDDDLTNKKYVDDADKKNDDKIKDLQTSLSSEISRAELAEQTNANNITTNKNDIDTIKEKIPGQASAGNQLADKAFVNSSVMNMAARFIGATAAGGSFASVEALEAGPWFHAGEQITELTDHDYAVVLITEEDGAQQQYRYGYEKGKWSQQYKIGSAFTAVQDAAINSGITTEIVNNIRGIPKTKNIFIGTTNDENPSWEGIDRDSIATADSVRELTEIVDGKLDIISGTPTPGNLVQVTEDGKISEVSDLSAENVKEAIKNPNKVVIIDNAVQTIIPSNHTIYMVPDNFGDICFDSDVTTLTDVHVKGVGVQVVFGKYVDTSINPGNSAAITLTDCDMTISTYTGQSFTAHDSRIEFKQQASTAEGNNTNLVLHTGKYMLSTVLGQFTVLDCQASTLYLNGTGKVVFGIDGVIYQGTIHWKSGGLTINNETNNLIVYKTEDFDGTLALEGSPSMFIDLTNKNLRTLGAKMDQLLAFENPVVSGDQIAHLSGIAPYKLLKTTVMTSHLEGLFSSSIENIPMNIEKKLAKHDHSSTSTEFGAASNTNYGHVRLINTVNSSTPESAVRKIQYLPYGSNNIENNLDNLIEEGSYLPNGPFTNSPVMPFAGNARIEVFTGTNILQVIFLETDPVQIFARVQNNAPGPNQGAWTNWRIISASRYTIILSTNSWLGSTAPYSYTISASTHRMGDLPSVHTYVGDDSTGWEETYDSPRISSTGDVTIYSNAKISLKVVIKP